MPALPGVREARSGPTRCCWPTPPRLPSLFNAVTRPLKRWTSANEPRSAKAACAPRRAWRQATKAPAPLPAVQQQLAWWRLPAPTGLPQATQQPVWVHPSPSCQLSLEVSTPPACLPALAAAAVNRLCTRAYVAAMLKAVKLQELDPVDLFLTMAPSSVYYAL